MYYYVYDEFVQEKKYERELIAIENRLADLGIAGRVARLALFKNADSLIADELKRGAISTVVVVGDDKTIHKVLDIISGHDVAFGMIPLGSTNNIAKIFGVPNGVSAVDILSARNLENIDAGKINGRRFVAGVSFPKSRGKITCDGQFTMTTERDGIIAVRNLICGDASKNEVGNPTDGLLETVVVVKRGGLSIRKKINESIVGAREIEIDFPVEVDAVVDGKKIRGSHFLITVEPMSVRIITGRNKMF